jgi:arylsulfatase A-like enzyme
MVLRFIAFCAGQYTFPGLRPSCPESVCYNDARAARDLARLKEREADVPAWRKWLEQVYGAPQPGVVARALALAVWLAWIFGLLEAAQHRYFRYHPVILTVAKVSDGVFWVAPLVYLLVFLLVLLPLLAVRALARGLRVDVVMMFFCGFLGAYGSATLARKVHESGALILGLGAGVMLARGLKERPALLASIKRTCWVPLVVIALTWTGLALREHLREQAVKDSLPPAASGAPNIVLVVMDTARADHLSLHGYARATSPQLERLAARGATFDNAWSTTSWTMPAHASMFTGHPAYVHKADREYLFDGRLPALAEFLRDRGYLTAGFSGNYLWINQQYGFARGFAHFDVYTPFLDGARTTFGRKFWGTLTNQLGLEYVGVRRKAGEFNASALQWLDANPGRPFFFFINYFDPHDPYWPPEDFKALYAGKTPPGLLPGTESYTRTINFYDALLQYTDAQLGRLVDELERRGKLPNTIFIVTSDHGESLGDHGQRQHGTTLYQEVARVHLLLLAPGKVPAGVRVAHPVSVQHIPATVAELVGAGHSPFPGPSLTRFFAPGWSAAAEPDARVLAELKLIENIPAYKSLIDRDYQFIWDMRKRKPELYRLRDDSRQLNDLASAPEMQELVRRRMADLRRLFPELGIPVESAMQK